MKRKGEVKENNYIKKVPVIGEIKSVTLCEQHSYCNYFHILSFILFLRLFMEKKIEFHNKFYILRWR